MGGVLIVVCGGREIDVLYERGVVPICWVFGVLQRLRRRVTGGADGAGGACARWCGWCRCSVGGCSVVRGVRLV